METKQNIKKDKIYTFYSLFYQLSVKWPKLSPFSAKLKNKSTIHDFLRKGPVAVAMETFKCENAKLFFSGL